MYKKADIILVKFPFTNLKYFKLRPALVVGDYKDDCIILAISSNKKNGINHEVDNSDLSSGELLIKSYIKINKITSIDKKIIYSKIGTVNKRFLNKVREKFSEKLLELKK